MRERDIFIEAVAKSADERAAYLATACGDDRELRRRVEELLEQHEKDRTFFLDAPVPGGLATRETAPLEPLGSMIGPYKLLQAIGEGGMGVVYMAEQLEPVQRKVALKVIKPGMDTRQVIARFEAERQALAVMDSPHIAKVLDAGTTAAGRPYFVMELVQGLPITRYCDEAQLSVRERLELFLPVCQAIQHAHQKGIIHRDIKPSNVMVALYDGCPVPKVIDFGVAKATGPKLTERTMFTEYGQIVGTLEYMSPEQANLNQYDIDTRSDIYSLGVLLYELLTGTTPFNQQRLRSAAFDEMLRIIREEEPQKPSTKLSASDTLPAVAANRRVEPARLSKLIRGDLDWIVMKALEKDRSRRYETANELALDMQRYLDDEPVQACPPSAWYRFRKLARRNKRAFVSAAAAGLVVVLVMVALTVGLLQVRRERDVKDAALREKDIALREVTRQKNLAQLHLELAQVAVHDCLTSVAQNPRLKAADFHELRVALVAPSANILQALALNYEDDPDLQGYLADVYADLAFLRQEMGDKQQALNDYQRMRDVIARLVAKYPDKPQYRLDLARAHHDAATIMCELGRRSDAEPLYQDSLAIRKKVIAEGHNAPGHRNNLALTLICLGLLCSELERQPEALAYYDEAATLQRLLVKDFPNDADYREGLAGTLSNRANLLLDMDQPTEAKAACQEAIALQEKLVPEFPDRAEYRQQLAVCYSNLGGLLRRLEQPEAEQAFADAIAIQEKLVADFSQVPQFRQELARSKANLGSLLLLMGKPDDATDRLNQALSIYEELNTRYPNVPEYAVELASTYSNRGHLAGVAEPDVAMRWFTKAIDAVEPVLVQEPNLLKARGIAGRARWARADARNLLGRHAEALQDFEKAIEFADGPLRIRLRAERAVTLAALKEFARAREEADSLVASKELSGEALANLACVYAELAADEKDAALAERHAARAVELLRRAAGVGFKDVEQMKEDPRLAPLRTREDFGKLLNELEKSKDK